MIKQHHYQNSFPFGGLNHVSSHNEARKPLRIQFVKGSLRFGSLAIGQKDSKIDLAIGSTTAKFHEETAPSAPRGGQGRGAATQPAAPDPGAPPPATAHPHATASGRHRHRATSRTSTLSATHPQRRRNGPFAPLNQDESCKIDRPGPRACRAGVNHNRHDIAGGRKFGRTAPHPPVS